MPNDQNTFWKWNDRKTILAKNNCCKSTDANISNIIDFKNIFVITIVSFNFSMFYDISNYMSWLRIRTSIFWYHRLLKKLKEMNEYYIIKISKAEIIAINVNGNWNTCAPKRITIIRKHIPSKSNKNIEPLI